MLEGSRPAPGGATSESRGAVRAPAATAARPAVPASAAVPARAATGRLAAAGGSRSSRRKRGLLRRTGVILPALGLAVLLVAVVFGAAYILSPQGSGASGLAAAIDALPQNHSVALLEQERQTLIDMSDAARTLSVASKPATVSPAEMAAAQQSGSSSGSSSSTSTAGGITASAPAPNPGTAQSTAYNMMPSFGFSQSSQWTCLLDIWNRESNWEYDAENPYSGAYGIPQALPGDKMATAGADWQTDPATQIKWGLGYIKTVYGTPCGAWDFELANGYY
jgi:hypothetical protein